MLRRCPDGEANTLPPVADLSLLRADRPFLRDWQGLPPVFSLAELFGQRLDYPCDFFVGQSIDHHLVRAAERDKPVSLHSSARCCDTVVMGRPTALESAPAELSRVASSHRMRSRMGFARDLTNSLIFGAAQVKRSKSKGLTFIFQYIHLYEYK
jgi:hypothetical protein